MQKQYRILAGSSSYGKAWADYNCENGKLFITDSGGDTGLKWNGYANKFDGKSLEQTKEEIRQLTNENRQATSSHNDGCHFCYWQINIYQIKENGFLEHVF